MLPGMEIDADERDAFPDMSDVQGGSGQASKRKGKKPSILEPALPGLQAVERVAILSSEMNDAEDKP